MTEKPLVILDPYPRRIADIFRDETLAGLREAAELIVHDDGVGRMPDAVVDAHIARAVLVMGQPDLPAERLRRARKLRGIVNVETNFFPNVDYDYCFEHGIHVVTPGSAFAPVVAETALAMAIDLARGITRADRAFRDGTEHWGLESNENCFSLWGVPVGIIGYGDLGRALHGLIKPFGCSVKAFDPWVPDYFLRRQGLVPATLDDLLSTSRVIFVFAGVSSENQGFLDKRKFDLVQPGSVFLLMSRAAVVNFPDMLDQAARGRLRIGTDVFPTEPVPANDPVRTTNGLLLSAHRAGAMTDALLDIGEQATADALTMLKGLPPVVCRKAMRETVKMSRSKPIEKT